MYLYIYLHLAVTADICVRACVCVPETVSRSNLTTSMTIEMYLLNTLDGSHQLNYRPMVVSQKVGARAYEYIDIIEKIAKRKNNIKGAR